MLCAGVGGRGGEGESQPSTGGGLQRRAEWGNRAEEEEEEWSQAAHGEWSYITGIYI